MLKLRYSQNFLQSNKTVKRILSLSNINKNDIVFEIGCGKGIITKQLSKKCNKVIGIELDHHLYNHLKIKFNDFDNVKIIEADFLDIHLPDNYSYKVFSNIPFNITTKIIRKLTNINNCPTDSYLIIQKEPALKYLGNYGATLQSLLLKPYFDFKILYEFQRFDFSPVPKVDPVLLHIKHKRGNLIERKNYSKYQCFIIYIFSRNNYTIKNAFREIFSYEQIKRLVRTYKFNINDNINSISADSWIELFYFFVNNVSKDKQKVITTQFRIRRTKSF